MSLFHSKKKEKPDKINQANTEWVPDHKHKHCMQCNKEFSMFHRKHHCRKCGNLVCGDCSKNEWYIESPAGNGNERVCDACFHKLSNHHPVTSNPKFRVLTEPNFFSWIATFQKSWIRSRYPKKYKKYKHQLLHGYDKGKKNKSKLKTPKISDKHTNDNDNPLPMSSTKKKRYNPLVIVQTGILYVNIMEAQGLPDCDTFSQPDGYCIFYVTNNDPCFGQTTKYSTKVQHNTVKIQYKSLSA